MRANRLPALLLIAAMGCVSPPPMPLLEAEPIGCVDLGVVWQSAPFPLWNDWRAGLRHKAGRIGADTLVLRHRYFAFALAGAYRCGGTVVAERASHPLGPIPAWGSR